MRSSQRLRTLVRSVHFVNVASRRDQHLLALGQDHRLEDVDSLRDVRHHHLIGVAVEDIEGVGSHNRVADGVLLVEEGRVGSFFDRVPGAPFIDDQADLARRVPGIHGRALLDHQIFHLEPFFEQAVPFFFGVFGGGAGCAAVIVRGKAVDVIEGPVILVKLAEEAVGPFDIVVGRAAGDDEQLFAKAAHEGSITAELRTVIFRGEVAAAAPVLVAHAPIGHVERFRAAIRSALLRPGGTIGTGIGEIAIFDPVAQFAGSAGADVAAEIRFGANQAAEADKFLGADVVGFDHFAPVDVDPAGSLVARADAILPVIVIGEAAARPADDRWFHPAQGLDDVGAEAVDVGDGRSSPTQMPS